MTEEEVRSLIEAHVGHPIDRVAFDRGNPDLGLSPSVALEFHNRQGQIRRCGVVAPKGFDGDLGQFAAGALRGLVSQNGRLA